MTAISHLVTAEQVETASSYGIDAYHYTAEISELRWQGWPKSADTNLGNGQPLVAEHIERDADGDVMFVRYLQQCGCVSLTVFND